ncbi:MAG: FAD-dependent oxidoreductase [Planctomycetota bacterium]
MAPRRRWPHPLLAIGVAMLCACRGAPRIDDPSVADLVVYGGTAAGVIAAITAADAGLRAVLLEPTERIGGMSTCGLGATDVGNKAVIGGRAREFYRRLRAHYADDANWVAETREQFRGRGHDANADAAWTFEPKVALAVLQSMLAETTVEVVLRARIARNGAGVSRSGSRIESLRTTDGRLYRGRIFLDASYEGDLLAEAGVRHRVGRESNAEYGETLNGVQVSNATKHQFTHDVDPYRIPGRKDSGLLPHIDEAPVAADGSADHRVQAYCLRLCTTDVPDNRLPWPKPANYDEAEFELLLRNFEAGDHRVPWHPVWMPNRKTDTNNNFAFSTDAIGLNYRWPDADWPERDALFARHLHYTQGLLWTLANHPRVPAEVRAEFQRFGLARDEFVESGNWPPQVYVREARRMVGDLVISERHCRGLLPIEDPVGMGSYGMDSHNVQRHLDAAGRVRNEGDIQVHGFAPYGISLRAILPKRDECSNLVVPVCVSATHIAFGSIRMEPVFMVLAESAAILAKLALRGERELHDVPYPELRAELLAANQVLQHEERVTVPQGLDPRRLNGVVVDDVAAFAEGGWSNSTSVQPYVGRGYLHDGDQGKGDGFVRFDLRAPSAGNWSIQLAWQPHANRARAVPIEWRTATSTDTIALDQTKAPALEGLWQELSTVELAAGDLVTVTVRNAGTTGHVVVDAARLLPVR